MGFTCYCINLRIIAFFVRLTIGTLDSIYIAQVLAFAKDSGVKHICCLRRNPTSRGTQGHNNTNTYTRTTHPERERERESGERKRERENVTLRIIITFIFVSVDRTYINACLTSFPIYWDNSNVLRRQNKYVDV